MDLLEEPCKQTEIRETCLLIGNFAQMTIDTGNGRELTREKMLEMLDQADDEGMVLQPQNSQDPHFICCCCGCCCGVLASAKKLPRPAEYFDANYYAKVDPDLCIGCGDCSTRCQMDAIIDDAEVSSVDLHRCIGCGLCVTTCPSEAVQLFRKTEAKIPPKDQDQLYRKILMERYGLLGMAKIMGKKVLGLKI
jgi:ferredoxin